MGVVVSQQPASTIMAEITLANGAEGAEELFFPGQGGEGEIPQQLGFLQGSEGKQYPFIPLDQTPLSQKATETFSETLKPGEQKSLNSKADASSYKESEAMRSKEFQVQKGEKSALEGKSEEGRPQTQAKADQAGRQSLQTPRQHPPATPPPREMMQGRMELFSKTLAKEKQNENQASKNGREASQKREKAETRSQHNAHAREQDGRQPVENRAAREQEKTDERLEEQKRRDDQEEGFAEENRRQNQEEDPNGEETFKVGAVEKGGIDPEEFIEFANQESKLLSELLNMRVNHFDVLVLFIEVMKLSLKGREEERKSRMVERELQLQHIQNMVDNFKQQGKWMLFSNLGSGVLSIVSGISPIVGHLKGDWILDKLSNITSKFNGMKTDQFFKGVTKTTFAMSEMYKSTGQIQNTFAESSRTYDQHMAEMRKTDWEEDTRAMDELKDQWKNMENFLHQSLQMYHDAIRQLYS